MNLKVTRNGKTKRYLVWTPSSKMHECKEFDSITDIYIIHSKNIKNLNILDTLEGEWITIEEFK